MIIERREGKEGRNENSLVGIRTEARATSRTHFYGSGIWVNVPKGRYDAFSLELVGPCLGQGTESL